MALDCRAICVRPIHGKMSTVTARIAGRILFIQSIGDAAEGPFRNE
jgi:hypothetical protein